MKREIVYLGDFYGRIYFPPIKQVGNYAVCETPEDWCRYRILFVFDTGYWFPRQEYFKTYEKALEWVESKTKEGDL